VYKIEVEVRLVIAGEERKGLYLCTLANEGTILWQGTGTLGRYATWHWQPSTIENRATGLFRIENDALLTGAAEQGFIETIHFLNAGTIRKSGTTGITRFECAFDSAGRIELGSGILAVAGDLVLPATSRLWLDIAGQQPGTQCPQLQVAGRATLDGELGVVWMDATAPVPGDRLAIVNAGAITGLFTNLSVPDPVGQRLGIIECTRTAAALRIESTVNPLPPVSVRLLGITHGRAELLLSGDPGADCAIEVTPDFVTWTTVLRTRLSGGTIRLQDDGTRSTSYYRAVRY
jgi:hypothetical protein